MKAALDLLSLADTKKIAILGDMFELGENSDFLHAEVGRYAVSKQIDSLICVGENSLHMFEEACDYAEGTEHIAHFRTLDALLAVLQEEQEMAPRLELVLPWGDRLLVSGNWVFIIQAEMGHT